MGRTIFDLLAGRTEESMARDAAMQAYGPALKQMGGGDAGIIGPMLASPEPRIQAQGQTLLQAFLQNRSMQNAPPEAMTPFQQAQVDRWNKETTDTPDIPPTLWSNYTPASIEEYQKTRKPSVLVERTNPLESLRAQAAQDREDRLRIQLGRLPAGQIESIIQQETLAAGADATAASMKPDYFGFGFDTVATAAAEYKRRTGSDTDFTSFWQDMDTRQAQMRHELFGATLTEGEQKAWDRIAIKPSDSYPSALAKLKAQQATLDRKRRVRNDILGGAGYDVPQARPPLGQLLSQ